MSETFIPNYEKALSKEEIKKIISENHVEFIKLEFCDINGTMKNLSVPAEQIDKALNNEPLISSGHFPPLVEIFTVGWINGLNFSFLLLKILK